MTSTSADGKNVASETPWPSVLRIASGDEFQQSVAVAQLAVKLCELKMAKLTGPPEKQNLDPKTFLAEAWKLIQNAREHVLRPQSNAEYLAEHGGSDEAREKVLARLLRPRWQEAQEKYAKLVGGYRCKFEMGVQLITEEKRLDRAMPWFRKYIRSLVEPEEQADAVIASLGQKGFHVSQLETHRLYFKEWKRLEKSRLAQASRKKDSPTQKN